MTDFLSQMRTVLPEAPAELAELYAGGSLPAYPESRIQFIEFDAALEYTKALAGWLIPNELGLWVLDDANDSNPFCYITKGPCRGAILHLHHDDDSTVDYPDLQSFVAAMHAAGSDGIDIDDMAKPAAPSFDCVDVIRSLLQDESEESESMVCLYLGCSGELPDELVADMAGNESFFIRESIGRWLSKHPSEQHLAHAEALASDNFPQVSVQGAAAKKAIYRVIHG